MMDLVVDLVSNIFNSWGSNGLALSSSASNWSSSSISNSWGSNVMDSWGSNSIGHSWGSNSLDLSS